MTFIDVHTHTLPVHYLTAMRAAGVNDVEGFPLPAWNAQTHLDVMDKHGIETSVLSISAPGLYFASRDQARSLARSINEEFAALRTRYPGRFGAFALLTLPDVDGALREMEHALDVLKLDGIGLLSNVHGVYLGDRSFDTLFEEANRRGAVVYTHPVAPPDYLKLAVGYAASALEYPFDTSRMILNLVASGTLRRNPRLRVIVSHGGGTIPYLAERVSNLTAMRRDLKPTFSPSEVQSQLKSLYYDVTGISNKVSLATYGAFVPADHRLFGSDYPFMPELSVAPAMKALAEVFDADALKALQYENALRLLPGLRTGRTTRESLSIAGLSASR